jgi:subtilisin family serine protease
LALAGYTFLAIDIRGQGLFKRFLASIAIAALSTVGLSPAANAAVQEPAFTAISASALWDRGYFGEGSSIAFIDQGVNLTHEYFQGEVIDGFCLYASFTTNFCPNGSKTQTGIPAASQRIVNNFPVLTENHGNMVAGIAAGKPNSVAPGGVAPEAKIVMANIDLTLEGITAAAQYILDRADANNTVALSLSFGGLFQEMPRSWLKCDDNPALAGLADVFRQLRDKGILTFASAGNTPTLDIATSVFPSCLSEVVAVGSVNQENEISWYVTMSEKIELVAPDYATSANTIGYLTSSGTSAAAPLAAGAFTLLRNAFPNASSEQILNVMQSTGTMVDDVIRKGIPMVNLAAAYNQLASGATIPAEPSNSSQKVTIGSFNGYIAIYTQGYEGRRMTAKVAGRWLAVDPITLVPGKTYSLTKRNTGAGYLINVEVYIDGQLVKAQQELTR